VGLPIDLLCYERDALQVSMRRRLEHHDPYFDELSKAWSEGIREVFSELPALRW
jgi:putative proteasome-type protease